jgi:hypothetical protein
MFGMSLGKNCYMLAEPMHARPLFSSAEFALGLASKNFGNSLAGFITTLSASPFVVSLNASRAIAPSLKRSRWSKRN